MSITEIISAGFIMGAVGSLHCIGMCGPLAMALPLGNRSAGGRLTGGVLYNIGRVLTYTWLGLVMGLAGGFLITPKIQSTVSLAFGTAILLYLCLPATVKRSLSKSSKAQGFFMTLRTQLGKLLSTPTNSSLFGIGMLNGLLPCGMIYIALTSSFLTGSSVNGGLFMTAFGLGTVPAMLSAVFFGSFVSQQVRMRLRKTIPVFMACMAALLVLRGLNLGIPYISPALPQDGSSSEVICH
ncbi:sulfite exporter TauE/SafE family protein [Flavisolibacter sp. BT320]|nr:sulfite exporter TauE/SafE family protein [Flavisolibacter longurius]